MMYDNRVTGFPLNFLYTEYRSPYAPPPPPQTASLYSKHKSTYSAISWPEYGGRGISSYPYY